MPIKCTYIKENNVKNRLEWKYALEPKISSYFEKY